MTVIKIAIDLEDSDNLDQEDKFSDEKVSGILGKTHKIAGTFASL